MARQQGRQHPDGTFTDLLVSIDVELVDTLADVASGIPQPDPNSAPTTEAPRLEPRSREWHVALSLAEPWLSGEDDSLRPSSNREIDRRILDWCGHACNLAQGQRVDDAVRVVARMAFAMADDPATQVAGRAQNVRFAVGRRSAGVQVVPSADLSAVLSARARGEGLRSAVDPAPG